MYTSYIGVKFLDLYNEKKGTNYNAEDFFNEIIFPLFFNNDKHFMNVANSSFFQSVSKKLMEEGKSIHQIKLDRFHKNVKEDGASLTTMVGYAAQGDKAGTSGQLTSLQYKIEDYEMYASWFGEALSFGVKGPYYLLINESELLWYLYQGWKTYRKFLEQTPNIKGNQIETWNGHWICHLARLNFDIEEAIETVNFQTEAILGKIALPTLQWSNVVFALSKLYPNKAVTAYCYNLAQTNTTLGFINMVLPKIRKLYELRDKIYLPEDTTVLNEEEIESLSTYYSFKEACLMGTIGLRALEPDKLRDYMPEPIGKNKEYKFSDEESYTQYKLFKIWIIAMLNKTELLESASQLAGILVEIENQNKESNRGKSVTSQKIKDFISARNLREFTDTLTDFLDFTEDPETIRNALIEILKMPQDLFPLFITLLRFEYNFLKKTKQ